MQWLERLSDRPTTKSSDADASYSIHMAHVKRYNIIFFTKDFDSKSEKSYNHNFKSTFETKQKKKIKKKKEKRRKIVQHSVF